MSEESEMYTSRYIQDILSKEYRWDNYDIEYYETDCPKCGGQVLQYRHYKVTELDGTYIDSVTVIQCPNVRNCDYKTYITV